MPLTTQVGRLERALAAVPRDDVRVVVTDLTGLDGPDLQAALDGLASGETSPFVLIGGRLVCTGSVDVEAVLAALAG